MTDLSLSSWFEGRRPVSTGPKRVSVANIIVAGRDWIEDLGWLLGSALWRGVRVGGARYAGSFRVPPPRHYAT
jgi:hypothetical protein